MPYVLLTVALVAAAVIAYQLRTARLEARRPTPLNPAHDNHQQMARWIDLALEDDMVAPLLPDKRKQRGRELLAAYYNERNK